MRILLISTSDIRGGAAIAAYRLMNSLNANGMKSSMMVREKLSDNDNVIQVGGNMTNRWNFVAERARIYAHNRFSRKNLFDISIADRGLSVTDHPLFAEADVIHLHWINQGMLSLHEIDRILATRKKVVWTMHDMWPFTGICHHAAGCNRYESGCGNCPYLIAPTQQDLSRRRFLVKHNTYARGSITFVACSSWLRKLAEKSPLTRGHRLLSIPNPIDTTCYKPTNKKEARDRLGVPQGKKLLLFAAAKASDPRKGTGYLVEASHFLAAQYEDIHILIAGSRGEEMQQHLGLPSTCMGHLKPDDMPTLYNAADLYVIPSLQENLPNTIMEAMACGTPCVGFDTGGIPEMIDHRENGYVARHKDAEDLASGIRWALQDVLHENLSANARAKVEEHYAQERVTTEYMKIYAS
ncbi:MAG: glycosyltransferase family 4 protein [bacterium]|nr:glycosyltransferase family 4 protein [bacterium]MDD3624820.1 glycosyltransferase family 4 protein [Proteiniphilum sp.]